MSFSAQGCSRTFLIHNFCTFTISDSHIFGGTINIATSIFCGISFMLENIFCHKILFSLGFTKKTLYPASIKSLLTMYQYFSWLFDAPIIA